MALDLSSLRKAVGSLQRALKVAASQIKGKVDTDSAEVIRAGVIQNFEFTYELCWKFMKRWLEKNVGGPDIDGATRKELFRMAAESRLISGVTRWFKYQAARNETAHTYDSAKAGAIYSTARLFAADAEAFLRELEKRND
ncbi:MAG: nucleotidyltransferase substrate binding protein [Elusimicrobia bacterium]|nr:nucleotidyltransferase substrate binding protein [Elusimicrobiota bacterium]